MVPLASDVPTLQAQVLELSRHLEGAQREIEALRHRLELELKRLYGRRTEKIDPRQLQLVFAEVPTLSEVIRDVAKEIVGTAPLPQALEAPDAEEPERKAPGATTRPGHGRAPIPASVPRFRVEYHPTPEARTCGSCLEPMRPIGEEVTEELDYVPAATIVRQHVRVKYACAKCQDGVVTPKLPPRPIDKGRPAPGLLAHVLTSKYADHLPLYRQSQIFEREGLEISRSTLCDWVGDAAGLLEPIVLEMRRSILESHVIHSDDTPITVLDPSRKGGSRRSYLWVYVGDRDEAVYDFTETRDRKGPKTFLGAYRGFLQADAYSGYDEIFAAGTVTEVGCWAHARRKFVEAMSSAAIPASLALALIQRIYRIEAEAKRAGLDPPALADRRGQEAGPILESLHGFLEEEKKTALPRSALGEAIGYTLNQWEALGRYVNDGRLAIDNNLAERALRRVAVGRKNWLFAARPSGGTRAAIVYSLVETCRLQGVEPFAYLRDVLDRVSTEPASRIAEFTPRGWKAATERAAVAAARTSS